MGVMDFGEHGPPGCPEPTCQGFSNHRLCWWEGVCGSLFPSLAVFLK